MNDKFISIPNILSAIIGVFTSVVTFIAALNQFPSFGTYFAEIFLQGNKNVGVKAVFRRSNDFLSSDLGHIKEYIDSSKDDIWFFGTTFYITVPRFREDLLKKLRECVNMTFIILNPNSKNSAIMAKSMGYTEERLKFIIQEGISALVDLDEKRKNQKICSSFSIWLTSQQFTSRIYMFDPNKKTGYTYLIPQIYGKDSTELPGLLLSNAENDYHLEYFNGIKELANNNSSVTLAEWLKTNRRYIFGRENN